MCPMCLMTAALIAAGAGSAGGVAAFAVKKFRTREALRKFIPDKQPHSSPAKHAGEEWSTQ